MSSFSAELSSYSGSARIARSKSFLNFDVSFVGVLGGLENGNEKSSRVKSLQQTLMDQYGSLNREFIFYNHYHKIEGEYHTQCVPKHLRSL